MSAVSLAAPRRAGVIPAWLQDRWGMAGAACIAYVLAYVAWTFFHWGGPDRVALVSDLAFLPVSLFAGAAAWRNARDRRLDPRLREAWRLLGISIFALFAGDLVWFWFEIVLAVEPFPSLADFFYLLFYPLALWGVLRLPGGPAGRGERVKLVLDLTIVLTTAWMVVWYFILVPTAEAGESEFLPVAIAAAYPIGDLVVLAGIVALLWRSDSLGSAATRSALLIFIAGLVSFVVADLAYGYTSIEGSYSSGSWVDIGWVVAYLAFALAALRQAHPHLPSVNERWTAGLADAMGQALPFLAIGLGYSLVLVVSATNPSAGTRLQGLFAAAAVLTAALLGRQTITLRENARLASELRNLSSDLERRVVRRTLELQDAQQALFASQKLASVGSLAAGVVHEVSNPLNTIITSVEAMETRATEGRLDAEAQGLYLPIVSRAARQAARIVQALRTYSRGSTPELVPQDLSDVIRDAMLLMGYQVSGWANVTVHTELDEALPPVLCDRNQMAQVLINLLTNARDAMPNGGTITVRTRQVESGVRLEVADQGQGIPAETLTKIFDPFFTTKGIGEGSGLGLSIVSGIVRAHRGTIEAVSDGPGSGAAFLVTLPLHSPG